MDRFAARRKLLRGSLSAPLVLTVASPAALAARSSWEACLLRAGQDPATVAAFIDAADHDTFLRLTVDIYERVETQNGSTTTKRYYKIGNGYFPYDEFGDVNYPLTNLDPAPSQLMDSGEPVRKNVLVRIDRDGSVAGFGVSSADPSNAFPVSGSCWASFGGMDGGTGLKFG